MTIAVYELDGTGDVRFSPYCWRTLLALRHKGFHDFERVPVALHDRSPIAFSNQKRVPVLADGNRWVSDSWDIACYLEDAYPDRPTLFGGDMGRANALFINAWVQHIHNPGLLDIVLWDTFQSVDPVDREWWRAAREKRYGPFEAYREGSGEKLASWRDSLEPLRATLRGQACLSGDAPAYADYIVFGTFQYTRCIGRDDVIEEDDPIRQWCERMMDLFGGYARAAPVLGS